MDIEEKLNRCIELLKEFAQYDNDPYEPYNWELARVQRASEEFLRQIGELK
jgi:hypothetical protein